MFMEDNIMSNSTEVTKTSRNGTTSADSQRHAPASESVLRPPVDIFETGESYCDDDFLELTGSLV